MKTLIKALVPVLVWCMPVWADDDYLRELEQLYQLPNQLLSAVYFVETSNGTILGTTQVETVLSKTDMQFLQKIARHTKRSLGEFYGSSKGCIGPFQFKPETWYRFKQDGDGDGVRDPLNFYDAAATAALYLAREIALRGVDTALARYGGALTQRQTYVGRVQRYLSKNQ
jgi:membrane-bound lytic murein transglycosylase B